MSTEQQPSDAELISAVRGGDTTAYGELFSRHVEAARRLARQLTSAGDVEDLVSEAFAKVLTIVQRGGGPDLAFRAYLLTAVRSLHIDAIRGSARLRPVDDFSPFDDGVPFRDTAVEGFENKAAAKAFATLPERWQLVLWHTEVEGQKPAEVAQLLGMSANSVSALAYRAREGLRQAFLNMHAQDAEDDACAWTQDNLGAYIRNAASKRDSVKVRAHIDECRRCMGIYLELSEVNTNLSGIIGPMVLGTAAAGYIAAAVGTAHGGLVGFVSAHASSAALIGLAAAIVVITSLVFALRGPTTEGPVVADPGQPAAPSASSFDQLPFGNDGTIGPADPVARTTQGPGTGEDDPVAPSTPTTSASVPSGTASPTEHDSTPQQPDGSISVPPTQPTTTPPTTTPTTEPETVDTAVVVTREQEQAGGDVKQVKLAVLDLPAAGGLVEITTSSKAIRFAGECQAALSCQIPGGTDLLNFTIIAQDVEGLQTVNFTVSPPAGVSDTDFGNNTQTVYVGNDA